MSTTCASLHVFVAADHDVSPSVIAGTIASKGFVSPASNGWVSVFVLNEFDEPLDSQLSTNLDRPVVSIAVHQSDSAQACLVVRGEVVSSILVSQRSQLGESEVESIRRATGSDIADHGDDVSNFLKTPMGSEDHN